MQEVKSQSVEQEKLEIDKAFQFLQNRYNQDKFPSFETRIKLLKQLKKSLLDHEEKLYQALSKDYGYRSEYDSLIADFLPTILGLKYTIKNLKKWMKPTKRHSGLVMFPSKVEVCYQPLGVVGIIVPWNFPIYLSLSPLVTALAAGNRAMIKMSELTPHTNKVMQELFQPFSEYVQIFEGEAEVSAHFSSLAFNHLLFTGSTGVGKHVARAAANNLTPITLELGGKSPVIIAPDAQFERAVESIVMGKCVNSGQICVAPDYIFVPEGSEKKFIDTFQKIFTDFYSENKEYRFTHIINQAHYDRLKNYLDDALKKGAKAHEIEGPKEQGSTFYGPCILTNVNDDMLVMQEEIFGSLLPVKSYKNINEALDYINSKPRPLALYIMSDDQKIISHIKKETHSGGVTVNDVLAQAAVEDAPFGGVGDSGIGHYHGIEGFHTFSKAKTVFETPSWLPRNQILMKNRTTAYKLFRKFLIK